MFTNYRFIFCITMLSVLITGCASEADPTQVPPADTHVQMANTAIPPTNELPPTEAPAQKSQATLPPTKEPLPTEMPTKEAAPDEPQAKEPEKSANTWRKTYGGNRDDVVNQVLLAKDGGYFIVGATTLASRPEVREEIYLIRTDAAGEVLWEKTYGGEHNDSGQAIVLADDGSLLIAGVTRSYDAQGMDAFLLKVDQLGEELWMRTYGGPLDEFIFTVQQTEDGGYILIGNIVDPNDIVVSNTGTAGYGGFSGRSNIFMLKTDSEGEEVWSHAYESEDNILTVDGMQTSDGGFMAIATIIYFPESNDDILVLKVDQDGNEVWSRKWEEGTCSVFDLIQTSDGNYLFTSSYAPSDETGVFTSDFQFVKFDSQGNEIWSTVFGDENMIDYGFRLTEAKDGSYISAGEWVRDLYSSNSDISLVKIDKNGELIWQQIIETNTHNMFASLLQHPEGGYVIAVSTIRRGQFDILLIKTDEEGNVAAD